MDTFNILHHQPIAKEPDLERLILINAITNYLLTKDEFNNILYPLGSLMKYYHINITPKSCVPLKVKKTDKDIMYLIPELVVSNNGFKNILIPLLINLLSHLKN